MNASKSPFDWVELPSENMQRVRPGMEGQRCYGGNTCLAPPQFRVAASAPPDSFHARLRASEQIVDNILKQG